MKTNNRSQLNAKGLLLAFAAGFLLGRKLKDYRRRAKAGPGVVLYEGKCDYLLPTTVESKSDTNPHSGQLATTRGIEPPPGLVRDTN